MPGVDSFDFLLGRWQVVNRKLRDPLERDSETWQEFESYVENEALLGGAGNLDRYHAPEFPGRPGFEAIALRLFEPSGQRWRIWWASTTGDGQLDTPVLGAFEGDRGVFESDEVMDGQTVGVRYEWLDVGAATPRWQQSFSFDERGTWEVNWTMVWHRA